MHVLTFFLSKVKFLLIPSSHVLSSSRLTHSIIWLTKPLNLQLCSGLHVGQFLHMIRTVCIFRCICLHFSIVLDVCACKQNIKTYNTCSTLIFQCHVDYVNKASVSISKNRAISCFTWPPHPAVRSHLHTLACRMTQGRATCHAIFRTTSSCPACWRLAVLNWRWRRWAILLKSISWLSHSLSAVMTTVSFKWKSDKNVMK